MSMLGCFLAVTPHQLKTAQSDSAEQLHHYAALISFYEWKTVAGDAMLFYLG